MMDWLKATAAAFTAVTALAALLIAFIYRCGGHLVAWYCLSVLVHPITVSTQEALKAGKQYLVFGGDCDARIRWESPKAVEVEILGGNYPASYEIAPRDSSRQISVDFKM